MRDLFRQGSFSQSSQENQDLLNFCVSRHCSDSMSGCALGGDVVAGSHPAFRYEMAQGLSFSGSGLKDPSLGNPGDLTSVSEGVLGPR